MAASRRCIFLAGAPEADLLSWDETILFSDLKAPFRRFLEGELNGPQHPASTPTPTAPFAKWRSLECNSLDPWQLPTTDADVESTQFLHFDDSNGDDPVHDEHLGFLEHSLALIDNVDTLNILPGVIDQDINMTAGLETSFLSTGSFTTTSFTDASFPTSTGSFLFESPTKDAKAMSQISVTGHLTDLKRIPNAEYISRIAPQTITVNLLVGIINVSPTRTVRLRKRDAEMDIIELTVGDETRAGFSISFWLVPIESQRKPLDDLRQTLGRLRSGDVVLVQNVALSCFNGCVYGQSLSRRFARNSTSIAVLGEACGQSWPSSVTSKFLRVQQWTSDFVGVARKPAASLTTGRDTKRRKVDELPPDTQD